MTSDHNRPENPIEVPHAGEDHLDPQSETVARPEPDQDPPVRTRRTPALVVLPVLLWIGLGLAVAVVALVALR